MQQRYGFFYRIANVYRVFFLLPLQQRHSRVGGNPLIHLIFRSLIYDNVLFSGLLRKLAMTSSSTVIARAKPEAIQKNVLGDSRTRGNDIVIFVCLMLSSGSTNDG